MQGHWAPNGVYFAFSDEARSWWDAELDRGSKQAMARFAEALLRCAGRLTSSMVIEKVATLSRCSVFTRISLPDACKDRFEEISGITLRVPPKINHDGLVPRAQQPAQEAQQK